MYSCTRALMNNLYSSRQKNIRKKKMNPTHSFRRLKFVVIFLARFTGSSWLGRHLFGSWTIGCLRFSTAVAAVAAVDVDDCAAVDLHDEWRHISACSCLVLVPLGPVPNAFVGFRPEWIKRPTRISNEKETSVRQK